MRTETGSERLLQEAMDLLAGSRRLDMERRANGGDTAPDAFIVEACLPDPHQVWFELDTYAEVGAAIDGAKLPHTTRPLPSASVVRVTRGDELLWLGVMSRGRDVFEAPPFRDNGVGDGRRHGDEPFHDWVAAWMGPAAEGPWMLGQCVGVDPRAVVRAAAACARLALVRVRAGEKRPMRTIEGALRWANGSLSAGKVAALNRSLTAAWDETGADSPFDNDVVSSAFSAASNVATAVYFSEKATWRDPDGGFLNSAKAAAEYAARSFAADRRDGSGGSAQLRRLEMAEIVRRHVPLGAVLLARVEHGRK